MELGQATESMNSALYVCKIKHKRLKPVLREFSYSAFMLSLDLNELEQLDSKIVGFSYNKRNVYAIFDKDYLPLPELSESPEFGESEQRSSLSIKAKLEHYLKSQNVELPKNPQYLLQTFPRIFGYQFNPVSFYYIQDADSQTQLVVAEVGNTYLEKKLYLIKDKEAKSDWLSLKIAKDFYVSPFSQVDDEFSFRVSPLVMQATAEEKCADKWLVTINNEDQNGVILTSSIKGRRKSLNALRLAGYVLRYPLMTLDIIMTIHWHALMMWLRKLPVTNKKGTAHQQKNILNPK